MGWRIYKYIQHLFYRKHRFGHGIHSPYLFEFVHQVVFNGAEVKVPESILNTHMELRKSRNALTVSSDTSPMGAGSKVDPKKIRTIHSFVKGSSVNQAQGEILFRMTQWQNPQMVLELGTGLGISTLYLASGLGDVSTRNTDAFPVVTVEGDPARANFSRQLLKRLGFFGVKVHNGEVDELIEELASKLPGRFLAFVDANHQYDPTLRYLRLLLSVADDEAIVVMDDIYWSKGMFRAWNEVISWPEVRVSLDLFHMGILLLRKDLIKTHLKIKI